jgi:hypothetical protein
MVTAAEFVDTITKRPCAPILNAYEQLSSDATMIRLSILLLVPLALLPAAAQELATQQTETAPPIRVVRDCGRWRWDVKILADPDTSMIAFGTPRQTTIAELVAMRPMPASEYMPRQFPERTVYDLVAELHGYAANSYRDIELVLRDPGSGEHIRAAIPDPDCPEVAATSRAPLYRQMRAWLRDSTGDTTGRLASPIRIRIVGVAFYDRLQNQEGMAENGLTLHPLLSLQRDIPPPPPPVVPVAETTPQQPSTATTQTTLVRKKNSRSGKKRYRKAVRRKRYVKKRKRVRRWKRRSVRRADVMVPIMIQTAKEYWSLNSSQTASCSNSSCIIQPPTVLL